MSVNIVVSLNTGQILVSFTANDGVSVSSV